jgi:hypothetical protein
MARPKVEKYIETKNAKLWAQLTTCEQNALRKKNLAPDSAKEKAERKPARVEPPKGKK